EVFITESRFACEFVTPIRVSSDPVHHGEELVVGLIHNSTTRRLDCFTASTGLPHDHWRAAGHRFDGNQTASFGADRWDDQRSGLLILRDQLRVRHRTKKTNMPCLTDAVTQGFKQFSIARKQQFILWEIHELIDQLENTFGSRQPSNIKEARSPIAR